MKLALVTGGARGIGLAIARRLRADGQRVAIADSAPERGRDLEGFEVHAVDVGDAAAVAGLAARFADGVEILVNNAGIRGPTAPVVAYPPESWEEVLRVNLTGPYLCARAFAPRMIERRWGRIINISSIAGKIGYALRSAYAASKWGLLGLTRSLARELGPDRITVNAVCPGPVANKAMEEVLRRRAEATGRTLEEIRAEYLRELAVPRMATEDEVAALVSYLTSEAAGTVTGQAIDVSSGYAI